MNSLERTKAAIQGKKIDRFPCFPILIAPACELLGVKQGDYSQDAGIMADTLIRARDLAGFDGIYVSRDNWVMYEALGGKMIFAEDDEPNGTGVLLSSIGDFRNLRVPDPFISPGMSTVIEAAGKVVEASGKEYYIQANIDCGPFSLAAILRGTQNFLLDIVMEDEKELTAFLDFCTNVVIAYGKAMLSAGVHGIQFGDATAGLVSPDLYERYARPFQDKALKALRTDHADLWVHICGNTSHILHFLRDLPFQGFEADSMVSASSARRKTGKAVKGNIDTTLLLQGDESDVYKATSDVIREFGEQTGLIVSPGCGVPRMTPVANLRAMVEACCDNRF